MHAFMYRRCGRSVCFAPMPTCTLFYMHTIRLLAISRIWRWFRINERCFQTPQNTKKRTKRVRSCDANALVVWTLLNTTVSAGVEFDLMPNVEPATQLSLSLIHWRTSRAQYTYYIYTIDSRMRCHETHSTIRQKTGTTAQTKCARGRSLVHCTCAQHGFACVCTDAARCWSCSRRGCGCGCRSVCRLSDQQTSCIFIRKSLEHTPKRTQLYTHGPNGCLPRQWRMLRWFPSTRTERGGWCLCVSKNWRITDAVDCVRGKSKNKCAGIERERASSNGG